MSEFPFIGSWNFVEGVVYDDGKELFRYPDASLGVTTFLASGEMTAQLQMPAHASLSLVGDPSLITQEVFAFILQVVKAPIQGYIGYFGSYTVEGNRLDITIEGSATGSQVGEEEVRLWEVSGDELILSVPPQDVGGRTLTADIVWRRAGSQG